MTSVSRKLWSALKSVGRWLGPALIVLAIYLILFPLGPWFDLSGLPALLGGVISAIALFAGRKSGRTWAKRILPFTAALGLAYWGFGKWEGQRGYHTTTMSFDNMGAHLVGTLYLPNNPGKHPGIVWVHGGGPETRGRFAPWAIHFARAGYAMVIFDKRGIGDSTGRYEPATIKPDNLELLASDSSMALDLLVKRPEVRADMSGFVGTSAGGWVTAKAAAMNAKTAFILLISGATYSTHNHLRWEAYHLFGGKNPSGPLSQTSLSAGLKSFIRGDVPKGMSINQAAVEAQKLKIDLLFPDYDPLVDLRKLNIPGLWVDGDADWTIPAGPTQHNIEMLRKEGKLFEYRLMPGGWHSMLIGPKKLALDTMDNWLARVTYGKH